MLWTGEIKRRWALLELIMGMRCAAVFGTAVSDSRQAMSPCIWHRCKQIWAGDVSLYLALL